MYFVLPEEGVCLEKSSFFSHEHEVLTGATSSHCDKKQDFSITQSKHCIVIRNILDLQYW